jgi:7-cyano-7-deazaguanine synthase
MDSDGATTHRVLLSGGVDSAVVLAMLVADDVGAGALWVDYCQAARDAEKRASRALARHYGVRWTTRTFSWEAELGAGEIPGRNDLLLASAAIGMSAGVISLGIHAGSGYPDCSPEWTATWRQAFDQQSGGSLCLAAPLLHMTKAQVYDLAASLAVPVQLTHSCEAGALPCGSCRSCLDREALVVRP